MLRPPRVLVAKPGLDGHDRGAKVVAYALRDAGCEVIYLGLRCSSERIVDAAIAEDVDVIGISVLSGAHLALTADLMAACASQGASDLPVVVGGTVPPRDIPKLEELGVAAVMPAGSEIDQVVERIIELARRAHSECEGAGDGHA